MKSVDHHGAQVILVDEYGMYGVFTKEQFQVIKQCDCQYPVPALREDIIGGGIKNHCVQIGATYVDVSRGELEIY